MEENKDKNKNFMTGAIAIPNAKAGQLLAQALQIAKRIEDDSELLYMLGVELVKEGGTNWEIANVIASSASWIQGLIGGIYLILGDNSKFVVDNLTEEEARNLMLTVKLQQTSKPS